MTQRERENQHAVWNTRISGRHQRVRCDGIDKLELGFFPGNKQDGVGLVVTRQEAKLLARRIEECLRGTPMKRARK